MRELKKITPLLLVFLLALSLFPILIPNFTPPVYAASDVDTSASGTATAPSQQRLTAFGNSHFWSFYYDGANVVYRSSNDNGDTWSAKTTLYAGNVHMSLWTNEATNEITWARFPQNTGVFIWRNGTMENDGSITWGGAEAAVQLNVTDYEMDIHGYLMRTAIGAEHIFVCSSIDDVGTHHIIVHRYEVATMTWSDGPIFDFSSGGPNPLACNILETTLGLVLTYSVTHQATGTINLVTSSDNGDTWGSPIAFPTTYNFLSATMISRASKVHYVLRASVDNLYYTYDFGDPAVSAGFTLADSTTSFQLSKVSTNILMAFWGKAGTVNTRTSLDNGATWESEIQREGGETAPNYLQSLYGHSSEVGLTWTNPPTLDVRFLSIDIIAQTTSGNINFGGLAANFKVCDTVILSLGDAVNIPLNVSYAFGASRIEVVALQFSDGLNNVTLLHNITANRWTPQSGSPLNEDRAVGLGIGTTQIDPNDLWIIVNYPISILDGMIDAQDIAFTFRLYDNITAWSMWFDSSITDGLAVDIYVLGGAKSWDSSGSAGIIDGGGTFEMYADASSTVQVNQTWKGFQSVNFQHAIRINEIANGKGEVDYWQDFDHSDAGDERNSGAGDWVARYTVYYCDQLQDTWIEGWTLAIFMQEGDLGLTDRWTALNATWSRNGVNITSDVFQAWPEPSPQARIRLWGDLWFDQQNASTTHGGRMNPYYYGMETGGLMFWGNWKPKFENKSETFYLNSNVGNDSRILNSRELGYMKIGINVTRGAETGASASNDPWRLTLYNYDLFEVKTAPGRMQGVATPIKVDARIPDIGVNSFLAPLYAVISRIGSFIVDAMRAAASGLWSFIAQQAPWFTDFWKFAYDTINAGFAWIPGISELIFTIGDLASPYTGFIGTGIEILTGTADLIQTALFPFTGNFDALLFLFFLGFFVFPIVQKINQGDWRGFKEEIEMMYKIINAIMVWIYRMVKFIIDTILGILPC